MSYYLDLLPMVEGPKVLTETLYYSRNRLAVGQNYDVYGQMAQFIREGFLGQSGPPPIQPRLLPAQLWISDEDGKKKTRTDAYGADLTFLYAYELRGLKVDSENRAIKAYIDALPDDTPIILFWH